MAFPNDFPLSTSLADATTSATTHPAHHNALADAVNNAATMQDFKQSCVVASTANITGTYAAGPPATKAVGGTSLVIDGVTLANGNRVFLKDQTSAFENGLYSVSGVGSSVVLTRTYDADSSTKLSDSTIVTIQQGAVNGDTQWELTTNNPLTIGTTGLAFTRNIPPYVLPIADPWMPTGAKYEAFPRWMADANAAAGLASGTLRLCGGLVLRAGVPVTSIAFMSGTTGAGTPTNQWFCLVDLAGLTVLAVTANDTTTAWASATLKSLNIASGPYVPTRDIAAYVGLLVTASTVPSLTCLNTPANANLIAITPPVQGTSSTGLTTPSAVGTSVATPAAAASTPYWRIT